MSGAQSRPVSSTPRDVSIGCGLSVRFDIRDAAAAQQVYRAARPGNLIGFYRVDRSGSSRPTVTPIY